jgi:ferric-dicitrate binding protein FerR (iron transport regulator)
LPSLPADVSAKEQEVRRLVDAGASSPEELRALAAKLEERRRYEDEAWRREVRPALMQSKKRGSKITTPSPAPRRDDRASLGLVAALAAGMIGLLFLATQTSMWVLVLPAIGVLVYAWLHGRRAGNAPASSPPPDASD